jgi:hypothetical protein
MAQVSSPITPEEARAIEELAARVYRGVAHDLGRCHVSDFYDYFYNEVTINGLATRWPGMSHKEATNPALESALEKVKQLDPMVERTVINYMRRHHADRKGMLRP